MDAAKLVDELLSAANTLTGFAVLQNVAFAYALLKRDLNLKIEGLYQWLMAPVGALWNGSYVWLIWWCSEAALNVRIPDRPPLSAEMIHTFELLAIGKCVTAGFFGFWPIWLIIIYNFRPFWPPSAFANGKSGSGKA